MPGDLTRIRLRILMEPRHGARYEDIRALARATEQAGFDAFFRSDHLLGVDPADPAYLPSDSWTTLAGLARDTGRVRLGTLVTAATFRAPALLAAIVATVDDMSGGRVELGIGTGWYEKEHAAYTPDQLRERIAVFERACEGIGRDPEEAGRSILVPVACGATPGEVARRAAVIGSDFMRTHAVIGSPEQLTERIAAYGDAGADTVYLHIYDIHDLDQIALLGAEVLPHVSPAALLPQGS